MCHTRQMPMSDDFDITWILDNTYGFVGADLAALVREAAMKALRRYLPEIDLEEDTIPPEVWRRWKFVWLTSMTQSRILSHLR